MRVWNESRARRFARFATDVSVSRPWLGRLLRRPLRANFDWLAAEWEYRVGAEGTIPLVAALEELPVVPGRVLDVGTGTGRGARVIAERFQSARIEGVDLSRAMIEEANELLPAELADRVTFRVADATKLPYEDGVFDLVVLLNMIPFFDELVRVLASDGALLFVASFGEHTPIYVPPETLKEKLGAFGFTEFQHVAAGQGTALIAHASSSS